MEHKLGDWGRVRPFSYQKTFDEFSFGETCVGYEAARITGIIKKDGGYDFYQVAALNGGALFIIPSTSFELLGDGDAPDFLSIEYWEERVPGLTEEINEDRKRRERRSDLEAKIIEQEDRILNR